MRARDAQGPIPLPEDEDNDVAMQEVVVQEMEVKHEAERDLLIEVHIGVKMIGKEHCGVSWLSGLVAQGVGANWESACGKV